MEKYDWEKLQGKKGKKGKGGKNRCEKLKTAQRKIKMKSKRKVIEKVSKKK